MRYLAWVVFRPVRHLALAGLLAFLYLYPFPYFEAMRSANELPRIYLTTAMVDEGRFAIDTGVRRHGSTVDVSPSGGHSYSNKAPGSSFLAVPAYLVLKGVCALFGAEPTLAQKTWTFRFATGVVPTLLFLLLLWRFLARFAPDPGPRATALAGYAAGTMAMTYSILFVSHQLSAVCIASAWILAVWVVEDGRDVRLLAAAGFLAGAAPLVDYQAAFAGVPLAIYLMWRLGVERRRFGALALTALSSLPPVALLLFYHARAFGHPLRTGYAASETFAHYHQRGFLGMDQLRWEAFAGSTVAPDNGLLFLCPMLLCALPGFLIAGQRRREPWLLGVSAAVIVIYLLFISSLSFWRGGWQVGPRYITVMLPFAMVPVAIAIAAADRMAGWRGELVWALVVGAVAVSIVIYSLTSLLFPHYPETFENPVHELVLRLLVSGHAPWNAGWLVGLRGLASLVPYLAALLALLVVVALPRRARLRAGVAGLVLAAGILALYGAAPGGGAPAARSYHRITTWMPGGS